MGQLLSKQSEPENPRIGPEHPGIGGMINGPDSRPVFYHALTQALQKGNDKRPGIPIELVAYILRLADCTVISRRLSMSVKEEHNVKSDYSNAERILWFVTPPLRAGDREKIATMQLLTVSRDQGWCSNPKQGSWSWFEVGIFIPNEEKDQEPGKKYQVKRGPDGEKLVWISHYNRLASSDLVLRNGRTFAKHEIMSHASEGDRFGVNICAMYPGWSNEVTEGGLRIEQYFDPVLPFPT